MRPTEPLIAFLAGFVSFLAPCVLPLVPGYLSAVSAVEAERLGEHATCGTCGAYARFRLISPSQVRCRKCDNEWSLIDTG